MTSGEIFGYIASALVFATFYMRTMLPLRCVAIASNLAFITYAVIDGLTPPPTSFRHRPSCPSCRRRILRANEKLFAANELADELFYVLEGEVFLPEVQ